MEGKTGSVGGEPSSGKPEAAPGARRKKRANDGGNLRYFLPRTGSSATKPELGQEIASEGEALIEAFKTGQPFYTLTAWKAVPEVNGGNPVIVRQAIART